MVNRIKERVDSRMVNEYSHKQQDKQERFVLSSDTEEDIIDDETLLQSDGHDSSVSCESGDEEWSR